ncbi:MAG: cupin domain-containing protein [Chlorobia bacterium]|nr:cupin domain-containing protein [Fimbriimonadaceae bacterium]
MRYHLGTLILDLQSGIFEGQAPQSRRTLSELAPIFAAPVQDLEALVYETHGCPGEVGGAPRLLYATTILQPGSVGREFFMTRGHFHSNPDRGELMFTLQGQGALILMERERETWMESMEPGSTHDIDGRYAHRVANTGEEPLVFLVAWMSDCGHDYENIRERGFGKRLFDVKGKPTLV